MRRDLDPEDWATFRAQGHRALDDMIDFLASVRERPVWTEAPPSARETFTRAMPRSGQPLADVLETFDRDIKPYATGNLHPAFMGWVHGAGTPVGMLAEMLAAGLNMNCGGRNHIGLKVEEQIAQWMREAFAFPASGNGLFVTGTSMANFMGVLMARQRVLDSVRHEGLREGPTLCGYAAASAHGCIAQAMEMAGVGSDALRLVPCDRSGAMQVDALKAMIVADRARGLLPFLVVGTAGSVDIGAIDPLAAIADLAGEQRLWFHVDGAFGALGVLSERLRPLLGGIERAGSIAFDFHKWGHVPYDAGYILARDGRTLLDTFGSDQGYLTRAKSGLAAGGVWPCDLGPDLSRGFRALKTWFTFQAFGTEGLAEMIDKSCALAKRLEHGIRASEHFALAAPVALNIVCFRPVSTVPDEDARRIVEFLHEQGLAAPSITLLDGRPTIRCAINNHRTQTNDIDTLLVHLEQAFHQPSLAASLIRAAA